MGIQPLTGRFMSPDPFFENYRDLSPYSYALSLPISFKLEILNLVL